jgi:hypothetical protein
VCQKPWIAVAGLEYKRRLPLLVLIGRDDHQLVATLAKLKPLLLL